MGRLYIYLHLGLMFMINIGKYTIHGFYIVNIYHYDLTMPFIQDHSHILPIKNWNDDFSMYGSHDFLAFTCRVVCFKRLVGIRESPQIATIIQLRLTRIPKVNCWWKKFGDHHLGWCLNPVNNRRFTISTGAGFLSSPLPCVNEVGWV